MQINNNRNLNFLHGGFKLPELIYLVTDDLDIDLNFKKTSNSERDHYEYYKAVANCQN